MQNDVYEKLSQILRTIFDDADLVARPDLTADQVPGWDSFGYLRLIFAVEKAFDVSFAAAQLAGLQNVGQLADLIRAKKS